MSPDLSPGDADRAPALLQTKLHAPRRRAGTVERRRLTGPFVAGGRPRLVLVSAPAGFGKTTLLTEWFVEDAGVGAPAWVSLDARDNDPMTFWAYVIASLRTVIPEFGEEAMTILRAGPPDSLAVVAALVAELDSVDKPVVLLFDDYHVIEASGIHDGVTFLLDHLPQDVSLVIATRVDPPLPLARLRARGELVERRASDLRFTPDEAAEYFNGTMGLDLTSEDVGALEMRTEGWVAALQLAALSLQGREDVAGFIESFTGDDRFVVDYLIEEVLERQPAEDRRFLLETAVLARLTGGLCDAVTGGASGRATLERLDRSNLFLVPLDDRREWYRYHHLFADVLRARLFDEQPELVAELHRRAAAWLADHDDPVEAIGHALAAEDFERAAELIEMTALGLHRVRREAVVRQWLEALPAELFPPRPVLSVLLVGARMVTGDPTDIDALLTGIERWLDRADVPDPPSTPIVVDHELFARLPAQAAVYRAASALLAGDLPSTMGHADRALTLAGPTDHLQRGSATALAGLANWTTGDLEPARTRYAQAVEHLVQAGHFADALGCSLGLADMCRAQGRLDDAIGALTFGLELLRERPGLRGAADMHAGLSELFLDRNELERSREHLETSGALGERSGLPQHPYRWRVATARLAQAEGDFSGALELLDAAEGIYNTDFSPSVRPIPALKARVLLAQGDVDAALQWADRRGLTADDDLSYLSEFDHLTLARTLVALQIRDRRDGGAMKLVDRLRAEAEKGGRNGVVVETLALLALVHDANGDRAAAAASIDRALALAEPDRHIRVFLEQGSGLAALLRSNSFTGFADVHCRRVLAAFSGEGSSPPPTQRGLVDELSSREVDVLRLLRSELSGPDIARELIVSLNTVRTHTKNIYAKLGVSNRREAVRRADELGL